MLVTGGCIEPDISSAGIVETADTMHATIASVTALSRDMYRRMDHDVINSTVK
jgi:hypothetical protein